MTVAITGDVHHMSMGTRDQAYLDGTEVEAAVKYGEIAAEYDVPVTLFCTGRCIAEEPIEMKRLVAMDNVELGGHNYWAFTTPVHNVWRVLGKVTGGRIGSWNGPRRFQSYEIRKTIAAFEQLGLRISSWRDHAYRHDGHTASLIAQHGITHFSDTVDPDGMTRRDGDLTFVPINTPPDHEHVYHAFRKPGTATVKDFSGPFGTDSRQADGWREWVLDQVADRREAGETATILAHPACMCLADGFDAFERLCSDVAERYNTVRVSEIAP